MTYCFHILTDFVDVILNILGAHKQHTHQQSRITYQNTLLWCQLLMTWGITNIAHHDPVLYRVVDRAYETTQLPRVLVAR